MLEVNQAVLVIIDVQEKLARVIHEKEILVSNLQKLVKGMAVLEVPVIVTEQYPQGLGPTVSEIVSLLPDVSPISKTAFSCWDEEKFVTKLKALHRTQVMVSGIEGHICVYQTASDLVANGYETYAVTDTITSRTPENRQLSFEMMKQAGAHLTGTETVLFELLKVAQGDKFKKISQIVK
jgi:nicotinamidase-related amidase